MWGVVAVKGDQLLVGDIEYRWDKQKAEQVTKRIIDRREQLGKMKISLEEYDLKWNELLFRFSIFSYSKKISLLIHFYCLKFVLTNLIILDLSVFRANEELA